MEVEAILRVRGSGDEQRFLLKWKGYDNPSDQTWEPLDNLDGCQRMLDEFRKTNAEAIVEAKGMGVDQMFKVKWRGNDPPHDFTWEPLENLHCCEQLVKDYRAKQPQTKHKVQKRQRYVPQGSKRAMAPRHQK